MRLSGQPPFSAAVRKTNCLPSKELLDPNVNARDCADFARIFRSTSAAHIPPVIGGAAPLEDASRNSATRRTTLARFVLRRRWRPPEDNAEQLSSELCFHSRIQAERGGRRHGTRIGERQERDRLRIE